MADEFKLIKQRAKGARARALLEDPLLKEAFLSAEKDYIDKWLGSLPGEYEEREELYRSVQNLGKIEQQLKSFLYTGEIAKKELAENEKREEPNT